MSRAARATRGYVLWAETVEVMLSGLDISALNVHLDCHAVIHTAAVRRSHPAQKQRHRPTKCWKKG